MEVPRGNSAVNSQGHAWVRAHTNAGLWVGLVIQSVMGHGDEEVSVEFSDRHGNKDRRTLVASLAGLVPACA
jgi:hypothetical protein